MENLLFLNLGGPEVILLILFAGIPFILMLVCLVDIAKSNFKDTNTKLLWIVIVLLAPLIGSLIYLVIGKNQRIANR